MTIDHRVDSTHPVVYQHGRGMRLLAQLRDELNTLRRHDLWGPLRSGSTNPTAAIGVKHVDFRNDTNRIELQLSCTN